MHRPFVVLWACTASRHPSTQHLPPLHTHAWPLDQPLTWLCSLCLQRRAALGLAPGDTDPALDDLSDEEWVVGEEPPELEAARSALAAYTARDGEEELPGG